MSSDPNGLKPSSGGLQVARMSKKPLVLAAVAGLILVSVLYYSVNRSGGEPEESSRPRAHTQSDKPLVSGVEGWGLTVANASGDALLEGEDRTARAGLDPEQGRSRPAPKPGNETRIVVVTPSEADRAGEDRRREADQIRRRKMQQALEALHAPLNVRKAEAGQRNAPAKADRTKRAASPGERAERLEQAVLAGMHRKDYDPAADRDKEDFFNRANPQGKAGAGWALPDGRTPGRPFELKTGSVIPAVMVSGINSDLPGSIIAQVGRDVYDTATGRRLLIPRGAKLYGVYDSRVVYGQSRVLAAWNRLIFPDGSSVTLGAMPGADRSGYAGFRDQVNNHYLRVFGSAVLMSLISGGSAYAMDRLNNSNQDSGSSDAPTMQDSMAMALANQLGQTTARLLEKNLNIKPTLEIRPGYRFNIIVTKDIVFEAPYAAWR